MIVLIGESASGKSTIEKELVNRGLKKIVSYTTRPIRYGEEDGIDYHYISEERFNELKAGQWFSKSTKYNSWYYGIARIDCVNDSVVVVEPFGFRQLKNMKDLEIISFYINTDERTRLKRMADRGDNLMELFRRIISDQGVFQGMDEEVNYVIDGCQGVESATDEIMKLANIVITEKCFCKNCGGFKSLECMCAGCDLCEKCKDKDESFCLKFARKQNKRENEVIL